jgi:hypothetical protein
LAGGAAALGFFVVFRVLIKLFFCMAAPQVLNWTSVLLGHAGTVPNPGSNQPVLETTEE